ncbi:M48 family metallopeptidase [Daejeonella sp. H1SJ63]|jgi:predicted Zn-dependent protease|uniref:M48 family metallopeptidase n=1 Tax=Daejeonella sp. H1SJ63 TaxID=3034145 RepID=UPI0023ED9D6D|nr:M48 family metallopeptidase [Daejeonella sp. H1SJ63]
MKNLVIYGALIVNVLMSSCSQVPLTGRSQLSLVDDSALQAESVKAYNSFLSDPSTKAITAGKDAQSVQAVGNKLAAAINRYLKANGYGNKYDYDYRFTLVKSDEINAWCMPGGKVAVYSGILNVTNGDAGLATVMGHEIAHAIAQHAAERYSQMTIAQTGGSLVGAAVGNKSQATQQMVSKLYGIGGQLAILKYSRNQESEADRLGLIFMAMAGYNPDSAVAFWERMAAAKQGNGASPEFLSSHPSDATRIASIKKLLPEARQFYTGARVK